MQSKEFKNIGETVYGTTLSNGLRLRVIPKRGFSTCYAVFATNYGGAHRRFAIDGRIEDTPAGVAHFLEHKMFDLPSGDNALNLLSANGASPNAFTSSGVTCYYFQCTEGFEENLRMLLHFVSTPYFTSETVQKEQGIIAQEIRMGEDNPGIALYYNLLKMLYAHHPIRDRIAGTVESILEISDKTLYDCHRIFYAPSNMVLCVEGDVDPDLIEKIALEELPSECAAVPTADFGEDEGLEPYETVHREAMAVSAPQFYIGAKLKPEREGEKLLRQHLISQLSMRILVGNSSPFYTRLYADGTLNLDFDYEVDFTAGTATVLIGGESEHPERVLDEFKAEVARVTQEGLDKDDFERAKRASLGARLRGLEDFDNVCVSTALAVFDGYCAFDAIALMDSITIKDCEDFIADCLRPERLAMSVIEPGKA